MDALAGLRVLELGSVVAGPFAASLLGDFGAEVVKVERPEHGDGQRSMGPAVGDGDGVWYSVLARNKRPITLDLKDPRGAEVFERLVACADVLAENFRPGVLERLGFGWDRLAEINPRLVLLRVSGFGQTGPYRERRGFGKVAEAFSGATSLTGFPDGGPVHPGYSLADLITGVFGAFGVLTALRARDHTGRGQVVDLALYEGLFRMIEWQVPLWKVLDQAVSRPGNEFPFAGAFVTDISRARDGQHVVVSASSPRIIDSLETFLREHGMAVEKGATAAALVDALRTVVAAAERDDVLEELQAAGLVAGPVLTAAELCEDPHVAARENIVEARDAAGTSIPMPAPVPKLSDTPGRVNWAGRGLGADTRAVLSDWLDFSAEQLDRLHDDHVI